MALFHEETDKLVIEGRGPLRCEHEKSGTWVRLDPVQDYAARGYCCVHGHIHQIPGRVVFVPFDQLPLR